MYISFYFFLLLVHIVSAVASVLGKIKLENLPAIARNLAQLGLKLSDLIANPGVFLAFLGDPTKSALLVELQSLLPRYDPGPVSNPVRQV